MASADRNPFDVFDGEASDPAPISTGDFLSEMSAAQPAPLAEPSSVTVPKPLHEENANPFDAFDEEPKVEKGPLAEELDSKGFFDNVKGLFGEQKTTTTKVGPFGSNVPEGMAGTEATTGPFGGMTPEQVKAQKDSGLGVMGDSWGMMTPEDKAAWNAERIKKVEGFAQTQDSVAQSLRTEAAAPAATNEDPLFAQFQKDLDTARLADAKRFEAGAQKSREEAQAIREGRIAAPKKTAARSGVENLVRGVGADVAAATVETIGIGAGYLNRGLINSSADPADNALYQIGQSIRTYVEERFPGDERRQDELAQMLARGAGQVVSLYGPAVALKAVGAGEKLMVATSAATGAGMEGSAMFNEANAAVEAEKKRLENEAGPRPYLGPTERDRFLSFMGGLGLGTTEAIPLATEFSGGMTGWRRVASKALEQGLEETVQEGGQTLGENVLAKATYDPTRSALEGVGTGMAVGGLLGLFGGGGGEALSEMMRWKEARLNTGSKTDAPAAPAPEAVSPAPEAETPPTATATPAETVSPGVSAAEPPAELSAIADQLAKAAEGLDEETVGPGLAKLAAAQRNRKAKSPEAAAKAATSAADAAVRAAKGKAGPAAAPSLEDIGAQIRAATPEKKAKGALGKGMADIAAEQAGGKAAVDRVSGRTSGVPGDAESAQKRITFEQELSGLKSKAKIASWADRNGYEPSDEEMALPAAELKALVLEKVAPKVSAVSTTETAPIATSPSGSVAETSPSATQPAETATQTDQAPPVAANAELTPAEGVQFRTAKGSTYAVQPDGTTVRNKAARTDVGHEGDFGLKDKSELTVYVSKEDVQKLGEFQTQGGKKAVVLTRDGKSIGVKYLDGKGAGKIERRTVVSFTREPAVGLVPVETWKGGSTVHFGNEIVEVVGAPNTKTGAPISEMGAQSSKRGTLGKRLSDITQEQSGGQAAVDRVAGVQRDSRTVAEAASATEAKPDLRSRFYDLLEGKAKRSDWAKELGVSEAELKPLVDEALDTGWLRKQNNSVFRVAKAKRPGRPEIAATAVEPEASPEATPAPEATAEPAAKTRIEDAGEKIGGARKDRWAQRGLSVDDLTDMTGGEQSKFVTKDAVWPKPDYAALVEAGMPAETAALVKIVRDRMAAGPRVDTPQGRRDYVEVMGWLRAGFETAKTQQDIKRVRDEVIYDKIGYPRNGGMLERPTKEQAAKLFSVIKGRREQLQADYRDLRKAKQMLADGFPKAAEPWTKKFEVRTAADGGFEVRRKGSYNVLERHQTVEAASQAAKAIYDAERAKTKDDEKKTPERPHLDSVTRTGADVRAGRDVNGDDFIKDFGFRGVEFGNWVASDERQKVANLAYDGLQDLALTLKIPAKAISLNGSLGLAFGARGSGKALAHYESGKLVINMTKLSGAGSLAHEWAHALDHYFGELDQANAYQGKARGATGWYERAKVYSGKPISRYDREKGSVEEMRLPNLRPEMSAAFDNVMQRIFKRKLDKAEAVRELELRLERAQSNRDAYKRQIERYEAMSAEDKKRNKSWGEGQKRGLEANARFIEQTQKDLAAARGPEFQPKGEVDSSYYRQAVKLSGKAGAEGYWARPTELFARSFESYVFDQIELAGNRSEYLVQGVEPTRYESELYKGNPYPTGLERESINSAFDRLFEVMESKETEKGSVALYAVQSKTKKAAATISPELKARAKYREDIAQGNTVNVPPRTAKAILAAVKPHLDIFPKGVEVGALRFVDPAPEGNAVATFELTNGSLWEVVLPRDDLESIRAFRDPRSGHVFIVRFGSFAGHNLETLFGELRHEHTHVIRSSQVGPTGDLWSRLVSHAKSLDLLDMDVGTYLQMVGSDTGRNAKPESLLDRYTSLYANRSDFSEIMDQEHVAHFRELVYHNQLLPEQIAPVQDILDILDSGIFGRAAETLERSDPLYALASQATDLSKLGYYSLALRAARALSQAKGTPEQMLAQLKKAGVKDSEIKATGLDRFLSGQKSITKDEIVSHLAAHAVEVREVTYSPTEKPNGMAIERWGKDLALDGSNPSYRESVLHLPGGELDAPEIREWRRDMAAKYGEDWEFNFEPKSAADTARGKALAEKFGTTSSFRSGHWSEPNVISHIRSSLQKDSSGRNVFLIDELQSDWGQKIRDGGVRDEAKIAGLKKRIDELQKEWSGIVNAYPVPKYAPNSLAANPGRIRYEAMSDQPSESAKRFTAIESEMSLLNAELRTAEAAVPAHPLVSTTDQWVGTSLRRILMQAVEAGADAVSFTPGKVQNERYSLSNTFHAITVDPVGADGVSAILMHEKANPESDGVYIQVDADGKVIRAAGGRAGLGSLDGKPLSEVVGKAVADKIMEVRKQEDGGELSGLDLEVGGEGMRATYDNIYPKTLAKILGKFDKTIQPDTRKLKAHGGDTLLTDKSGKPIDFITFPLTEEAKAKIAEGLPLFAAGASRPPLDMSPEARKARAEEMGFDTSRVWYHGTAGSFDAFDVSRAGSNIDMGWLGKGVYFGSDPRQGNYYAEQAALHGNPPNVIPVYLRMRNPFRYGTKNKGIRGEVYGEPSLPSSIREEVLTRAGFKYDPDAEPDFAAERTLAEAMRDVLTERGYDGVIADFNNGMQESVIFDPSNIRSTSAAFDPALDGENNLLYAIGAPSEPRVPKPLLEIMGDFKDVTGTPTTQQLYGLSVLVRDARDRLRQVLRLKPNSRGMAAEVTGQYDRAGGIARMRTSGDIATLTHEGAHHLETTFGDALSGLMGAHKAELEPLASPGGDSLSEGFAEWFSAYVRDPDTARLEAPGFYQAFEEFLDAENPGMLEGLQQVQQDYAEYLNADPVRRGTADIQTSAPPGVIERTARAMGNVTQTLDLVGRTASNWFLDRAHPVRATVKSLLRLADANGVRDADGRRISLKVWENAYKIARMIPGGYKSGHMMIIKGVPDYGTFDVSGPSLQDAVAFAMGSRRKADWTRENLDRFGLYLKARRAMAEYDRYTAKLQGLKTLADTSQQASAMRSAANDAATRMAAQIESRQQRLTATTASRSRMERELRIAESRLADLATRGTTRAQGQAAEAANDRRRYQREIATLKARQAEITAELTARQDRLDMLQSSLDGLDQVIEANRAEKKRLEKQGPMRPPTREPRAYYAKIKADLDQQFPQYAQAASMVAEWQRRLLKFERDAGRWSEEQYQALLERSDWYVPFMRKMDDLDTEGGASIKGKGNIQKFRQAKRFKGSDRDIINPIESMMERAYHTGIAAMFNDMVGALANQAERAGPGGRAILERVSRTETVSGTPDVFDQLRQQAIALGMDEFEATMLIQRFEQDFSDTDLSLVWSPDRVGPGKVLTVPLWENGKRNAVRLNDPKYSQDLFDAMQGLSHQQLNLVTRIMGAPARMLSRGVVSHPAFVLPNIIRDALAATFVTGAPPLWTQAKGIYYELGESTAGSALLRSLGITPPTIASTYQAAGGIMGGQMSATMSALKDKVAIEEMRRRGFHFANWRQGLNPLSDHNWAQVFSEMSETATRLGVFAHALKRAKRLDPTMSDFDAVREAAFTARDVMDFDRRGSKMLSLTHIIAFLNPALQGVSVATRTLRGQSDRGSAFAELAKVYWRNERGETLSANDRAALVTATKMMAFASIYAVLVLVAHLLQEDDDEYREIQETTSSRDLPVKIGGQWIRIPKPFEYALPANMLIAGVDYARGKDPRLYSRWADQFVENVTPPAAPQIMTLVGGYMYNTDAFGNDIVNMGEQRLPGVMQFDNYTSQLAIEMALAADRVGVELSPEMIDFTLTTAGGYWGKDVKLLSDQLAGKESQSVTDKFLIGPLTSRLSINLDRSSAGRSEFWTLMGQAGGTYTAAAAGYKKVMESGAGALMSPERYLSRLSPEEQAYAILKVQFEGDGKTQRYHPLERAKKVMEHYRDVSKEIILNGAVTDGSVKPIKGEPAETFPTGPAHGAELRDILGRLQMMEAANALIAIGHDQWSVRRPFDTKLVWDELRASSPEIADELERRIEKDKVEDYAVVAKAWPSLRDMLIKDQSGLTKADLKSELQTTP